MTSPTSYTFFFISLHGSRRQYVPLHMEGEAAPAPCSVSLCKDTWARSGSHALEYSHPGAALLCDALAHQGEKQARKIKEAVYRDELGKKTDLRFPLFYNLSPVHHCQFIAEMLYYPRLWEINR